jgi:hypothetical protein
MIADLPAAHVWARAEPATFNRAVGAWRDPTDDFAWEAIRRRLSELFQLRDNWDGAGAIAPSAAIIQSVADLLESHHRTWSPPSRVVPTADGTIAIEWQDQGLHASLEVTTAYQGDWLIERHGYAPEFISERWAPEDNQLT